MEARGIEAREAANRNVGFVRRVHPVHWGKGYPRGHPPTVVVSARRASSA